MNPSRPYRRAVSPERAHKQNLRPPKRPAAAYPLNEVVGVYSTYFPFPMSYDGGDEGGTLQVRITAKNPAKPTWPKPIKACVSSRYKGSQTHWLDLSQIELRTAALLSGEESMLSAYRERRDLHSGRVFELFPDPDDLVARMGESPPQMPDPVASRRGERAAVSEWRKLKSFDIWRQSGKSTNFADLFWAAAIIMQITFLRDTGVIIPIDVFRRAEEQRPHIRPTLFAWQHELVERAVRDGVIELPIFGQSRSFAGSKDHIRGKMASTVVNFPVQSTAANVLLCIQFEIRKLIRDHPRLTRRATTYAHQTDNIYDAIGFDCPEPLLPYLTDVVRTAIDNVRCRGYWARIQDHYGHECPLEFESTFGAEDE